MWSILLYAVSVLAAAFSTTLWQFLFFRCTTFIGVSVEFVAAVAWLAEIFEDSKVRERVLGYTQAFSSLGGIMIAQAYLLVNAIAPSLPAIYGGPDDVWRYTLLTGFFPALPLLIIRPFLPESPAWQKKRAAGTLKRPSIGELFSPALRRTTIVTTLMMACAYGAAFGAIQQMPRIVPGMTEIATLAVPLQREAAGEVQSWQEIGGLAGRFALAMLVVAIAGRRNLLRLFQIPGVVVLPVVFATALSSDVTTVKIGMFFAGFFTVAQFSFWGNYLPRVYPTHLRGTGEGFSANIGGRMIGTSFAFVTTAIVVPMMSGSPPEQLAKASTLVVIFVSVCGLALSFALPEPKSQDLPE